MQHMYTVVIPSAKIANVERCVAAIRLHQPDTPIIVVSDDIPVSERSTVPGVRWIEGQQPFCYATNANLGIRAAGCDDVILCNDDAILANQGGFDLLAAASSHYGIVSATVFGRCCNERQRLACDENHTEPSMLAFVCVYIRRATIRKIGLLDERFLGGCYEDNDYCRRASEAGISLGICGRCRVIHEATHTTFAARPNYREILEANRQRFEEKWQITRTLLSICICSIFTRSSYLERLLAVLRPQLGNRVELLLSIDAGQVSIGEKRQRMIEQAAGLYVVFIDDDDLVSPDYVREILAAIHRRPEADCITYRSKRYCDGLYEGDCTYSLSSPTNEGFTYLDGFKTYQRFPYHVTPIRREIALKVGFESMDFREDTVFAERLRPHLQTEEFIDAFLYEYWWRTQRPGEQTHKTLTT